MYLSIHLCIYVSVINQSVNHLLSMYAYIRLSAIYYLIYIYVYMHACMCMYVFICLFTHFIHFIVLYLESRYILRA